MMKHGLSRWWILSVAMLTSGQSLAMAAVITPGFSRVEAFSRIDVTVDNLIDDQTGTLGPLSASSFVSDGALDIDVDVSAAWANAGEGTVLMDYARLDVSGTSELFSGQGDFQYVFTVSAPTTVEVDFDILGTFTNSPGAVVNWHAMQGYTIGVDGAVDSFNFIVDFSGLSSPQGYLGTSIFPVAAGSHTFNISVFGGALGSFAGDRAMTGTFTFLIPEPSTLALGCWILAWFMCTRWRRGEPSSI